jgi:hypothetical protein
MPIILPNGRELFHSDDIYNMLKEKRPFPIGYYSFKVSKVIHPHPSGRVRAIVASGPKQPWYFNLISAPKEPDFKFQVGSCYWDFLMPLDGEAKKQEGFRETDIVFEYDEPQLIPK